MTDHADTPTPADVREKLRAAIAELGFLSPSLYNGDNFLADAILAAQREGEERLAARLAALEARQEAMERKWAEARHPCGCAVDGSGLCPEHAEVNSPFAANWSSAQPVAPGEARQGAVVRGRDSRLAHETVGAVPVAEGQGDRSGLSSVDHPEAVVGSDCPRTSSPVSVPAAPITVPHDRRSIFRCDVCGEEGVEPCAHEHAAALPDEPAFMSQADKEALVDAIFPAAPLCPECGKSGLHDYRCSQGSAVAPISSLTGTPAAPPVAKPSEGALTHAQVVAQLTRLRDKAVTRELDEPELRAHMTGFRQATQEALNLLSRVRAHDAVIPESVRRALLGGPDA